MVLVIAKEIIFSSIAQFMKLWFYCGGKEARIWWLGYNNYYSSGLNGIFFMTKKNVQSIFSLVIWKKDECVQIPTDGQNYHGIDAHWFYDSSQQMAHLSWIGA